MRIESEYIGSASIDFGVRKEKTLIDAMKRTHKPGELLEIDKFIQLPLADLRILSGLYTIPTADERFGCIGLKTSKYFVPKRYIDKKDPSYSVDLAPYQPYYSIHFTPFGLIKKEQKFALGSVYLLNADMERLVKNKADERNHKVITVYTNPTMLEYTQRQWGFRQHNDGLSNIFIATSDLIPPSDTFIQRLETTQQSVYQRAGEKAQTTAGSAVEYEKELRVLSLKRTLPRAGVIFQTPKE